MGSVARDQTETETAQHSAQLAVQPLSVPVIHHVPNMCQREEGLKAFSRLGRLLVGLLWLGRCQFPDNLLFLGINGVRSQEPS